MHGPEREGGAADPVGQRGAVERDALAGIDLRLAIERRVVGIFGDQHMRDQRLGRDAVLDQPLRRRCLADFARAGAAGVFGAARDDHLQPSGDHVEPFGDILADAMLETAAAGAGLVLDIDDDLFARQMQRQRAAIDLPLARCGLAWLRPVILLRRSFGRRDHLLQVLERKGELIGIKPLGAAAEAMPLQLLDNHHQPFDLAVRAIRFAACGSELLSMPRPLGQQQSLQRIEIGRERIRSGHHAAK